MGAQARSAHGTTIEHQPAGDSTFRNIGEVKDVTLPALTRDVIDTTTHSDEVDSAIPGGILHLGELEFEVCWNPDDGDNTTFSDDLREASRSHQRLQDSAVDGTIDGFRVQHPGGRTTVFSGFVTSVSEEAPVNDLSMVSVSVKPINAIQYNTPGFLVIEYAASNGAPAGDAVTEVLVRQDIAADLTDPSGTTGTISYQWQRKSPGLEWSDIDSGYPGEDSDRGSYIVYDNDEGNRLRCIATYTDAVSGTSRTVNSSPTGEIGENNIFWVVSVTGTVTDHTDGTEGTLDTAAAGDPVFRAKLAEGLTAPASGGYKWQSRADADSSWANIPASSLESPFNNGDNQTIKIDTDNLAAGEHIRVRVTYTEDSVDKVVYSDPIILT